MLSKKFLLCFNHINYFQRLIATSQNLHYANVLKDTVTKTQNIAVSKIVHNYLRDAGLEYFINRIPKKFLRKSCGHSSKLLLFDHKIAKEISLMLSEDLLQNSCCVIECNPGLGLLTQELLKIGVPYIHLYEKMEYFCHSESPLGKLIMKHKERLDLRKLNFFEAWLLLLRDKHNSDNLADAYLVDIPHHSWQDDPFAQIIAYCPSRSFFSLLMHNFFNQTELFKHGRPTFFLILPLDVWRRAVTANNLSDKQLQRFYNHYNVLLHLFFEFKCLGEIPRQAFAPWPRVKPNEKIKKLDIPMQVIKLEPKSNTFDLITNLDLKSFWFFLKHTMRSKSVKVIQEMEKWVPGCGPRLILLKIDICTTFKELSPTELFELFKNFRSWPEYDEDFFVPMTPADEIKKEDEEKIELEEAESEDVTALKEITEDDTESHSSVI